MTIASIKKKTDRKYKITVSNGYTLEGKKRSRAKTITVPSNVPKRNIMPYVYTEAQRMEKRYRTGIEEDEYTKFEVYAANWIERCDHKYKANTLIEYGRKLVIINELIGGIPLCKIRPMQLEELCELIRKRTNKGGVPISEWTVLKYLNIVSAVLEDARKNEVIDWSC